MKNSLSAHSTRLLSIAEVAWLLGIDNSCVCRAIRVGLLPVARRGRRLLIPAYALTHLAVSEDSCANPDQALSAVRGDAE
jgi:excisionase family DNA binding protein